MSTVRVLLEAWSALTILSDALSYPVHHSNPSHAMGYGIRNYPFAHRSSEMLPNPNGLSSCSICKGLVNLLHIGANLGIGFSPFEKIAIRICQTFHVLDDVVCTYTVREFAQELWDVFTDGILDERTCGLLLGTDCAEAYVPYGPWYVDIPPRRVKERRFPKAPTGSAPLSKVLHVTDIHLDERYAAGSEGNCQEPLCCRKESRKAAGPSVPAPRWGYAGHCDTSELLYGDLFAHLNKTIVSEVDYIMWTGDVSSHDFWNQTKEGQVAAIDKAVSEFRTWFPNTKVFPCVGNHEGWPADSIPPPFVKGERSSEWLLNVLAKEWRYWLPEETTDTIRRGGFYTVLVHEGFRIVSLNTIFSDPLNFWLFINSTDPAGQLQWLVQVLVQAERNEEKVHIIGHIPPSHGLYWWSYNYYRIVDRFSDTITGQFFGHTHFDHYILFYDMTDRRTPINVAYIGPSVTPYRNMFPGYRVYDVDGSYPTSTKLVVNHKTFIFNLTEAAESGSSEWRMEYTAKEHYKLNSLLPKDWNDLSTRMQIDSDVFQSYYRFYTKGFVKAPCDDVCRQLMVCATKTGLTSGDRFFCDDRVNFDQLRGYRHIASGNC